MTAPLIVVTADFRSPDGAVPSGEVVFDLTGTLSDPADLESIAGGQVKVAPDVAGRIAQALVANDVPGIVPSSNYWITERITGATERAYYARVPSAPTGSRAVTDGLSTQGSRNLTSAAAHFVSGDLGSYVFCTAFPVPSRIQAVVSGTVVEVDTAAVLSTSSLPVLVGASVDLSTLRPL